MNKLIRIISLLLVIACTLSSCNTGGYDADNRYDDDDDRGSHSDMDDDDDDDDDDGKKPGGSIFDNLFGDEK